MREESVRTGGGSAARSRFQLLMIDFSMAYPNSRKIKELRTVPLSPDGPVTDVQVPMREVMLSGGEAPVRLYDTSGSMGHDVRDSVRRGAS